MSRNYGSVGRRSSNAAWQWVVIGIVLGFGCSVILVLGGLAAGVLSLDPNSVADLPTQTPFIVTATPEPVTPTLEPTEAPETTAQIQLEIQPPTASPTIAPTLLTLAPTMQPTAEVETTGDAGAGDVLAGQGAPRTAAAWQNLASELIFISGGTFQMGTTVAEVAAAVEECLAGYGGEPGNCQPSFGEDSYPQHPVTVSDFYMEITEVSYAQYLAFLNSLGPGSHRNGCFGQPCLETRNDSETSNVEFDSANYTVPSVINDFPVTNVTWYGARAYCEALGRRLPTEAEWERAARGDNGFIYPWGNEWDATRASTRRPASGDPAKAPIAAFPEGVTAGTGLYNMAGNVAEWVSDWYDPRFYSRPEASVTDPTGPAAGSEKVVRGGSWDSVPFFARTVHRQSANPLSPTAWIGFRCASDSADTQPLSTEPIGSDNLIGGSDLEVPAQTPDPATLGLLGSDEEGANSQPTLPPAPTQPPTRTPQPTQAGTLAPG